METPVRCDFRGSSRGETEIVASPLVRGEFSPPEGALNVPRVGFRVHAWRWVRLVDPERVCSTRLACAFTASTNFVLYHGVLAWSR